MHTNLVAAASLRPLHRHHLAIASRSSGNGLRLAKLIAWPRFCSAARSGRRRDQDSKRNQLSGYLLQQ